LFIAACDLLLARSFTTIAATAQVPISDGGNTKVYTSFCTGGMFDDHPERYAQLAWTIFRIAFWTGVAGVLHRNKWYWAL
jgi:hypothetical protein